MPDVTQVRVPSLRRFITWDQSSLLSDTTQSNSFVSARLMGAGTGAVWFVVY